MAQYQSLCRSFFFLKGSVMVLFLPSSKVSNMSTDVPKVVEDYFRRETAASLNRRDLDIQRSQEEKVTDTVDKLAVVDDDCNLAKVYADQIATTAIDTILKMVEQKTKRGERVIDIQSENHKIVEMSNVFTGIIMLSIAVLLVCAALMFHPKIVNDGMVLVGFLICAVISIAVIGVAVRVTNRMPRLTVGPETAAQLRAMGFTIITAQEGGYTKEFEVVKAIRW